MLLAESSCSLLSNIHGIVHCTRCICSTQYRKISGNIMCCASLDSFPLFPTRKFRDRADTCIVSMMKLFTL